MPNRNAVDEREKYDHSGHSTQRRQEGDLTSPGGRSANEPVGQRVSDKDKPRASQPASRRR